MTKEEILHKLQKENPHSIPTFKAMDVYARQQAIAFFKWNAAKVSEYMDYLRRVDQSEGVDETELALNHFEGATIDGRYSQFIEQQNKHDNNG